MILLPQLFFTKERNPLAEKIREHFEKTRMPYLSARTDPKSYQKLWAKTVDDLKNAFDDLDDLLTLMLVSTLMPYFLEKNNSTSPNLSAWIPLTSIYS